MEEERRMNERIILKEEMRLKKERWLVEEQMLHVQEEYKMRMKAEQKRFQEERCKIMDEQNQLLNEEQEKQDEDMKVPQAIEKVLVFKSERVQIFSVDPDAVAQPVTVEEEKGLSMDSSNVRLISAEDEIAEEKPKLPKRKFKKFNRMTVAELQQKENLKASSNIIIISKNWCFKRKYSQDKSGIGKLLGNCRILSSELVL
ncbi:hypothetical protein TNCV_2635671 [Trichonephila clavipes]|nr:hypothetical protein TNCV_2635671 [Trichonephila clavipes]